MLQMNAISELGEYIIGLLFLLWDVIFSGFDFYRKLGIISLSLLHDNLMTWHFS